MRIAKAVTEGRWHKVQALTYLLTRSLAAKLVAVRRVTSNKGRRTPGIDGILWKDAKDKINAVLHLHRRGYHPQPLRRIYIPKKNGKKRPLSIPTMCDRAVQALYALALAPVAETTADRNSYGFREGRSCQDAIAAVFNALSKPNSATWVLEGDIEGCYDNISHEWLIRHVPMDREILRKWLGTGYVEGGITYPTHKGTPQGGIISPLLANMTKFGRKLIITPNKKGVLSLIRTIGDLIRRHTSAPMEVLITKLNSLLRGWANYHRYVVAARAFGRVDDYVYHQLWRMLHYRHDNKSSGWLFKKYWSARHECMSVKKLKTGNRLYRVLRVCSLKIVRHVKIKADANPYLAEYASYFYQRRHRKGACQLGALSARLFRAQMARGITAG
jgi:retron-type reverse transcriptase